MNPETQTGTRISDPNIPQRQASDPQSSAWVSASAGTGKTKVLTDRVLRILLPEKDKEATPPHRLLCITYTKAAATEMSLRINDRLASWSIMDEKELKKDMENRLLGHPPTKDQIKAARTLFTQVIDTPGGLKIMTIHAFCQSILGRFPLEAGLTPNFRVIDDREATLLLSEAMNSTLKDSSLENQASLTRIATEQNEEQLTGLLKTILKERLQLTRLIKNRPDQDSLKNAVFKAFSCPIYKDKKNFLIEICHDAAFNEQGMHLICTAMAQGSKSDQERGVSIQKWLDADLDYRIDIFKEYSNQILTKDGNSRKLTKKVVAFDPACEPVWEEESERLKIALETIKKIKDVELTTDLVLLGASILKNYEKKKKALNLLDYDDLILSTLTLLQKDGQNAWVLFKLDGGLDHILLDEAQDTNPEQWKIIERLCAEFFTGKGQIDNIERTLFVVGDEKQSIYSFQRADPESFQKNRTFFRQQVEKAEKKWKDIDLFVSFRSCEAVLTLVDNIFTTTEERRSLALPDKQNLSHQSFRTGQAGKIELWPLFETKTEKKEKAEKQNRTPWKLPISPINRQTAIEQMAKEIALKIKTWIEQKEYLPSKDRAIHAGDIMILLRTRTNLVKPIVRALKSYDIPVSGIDRMVLKDRIEILDLLALGRFCLLPEDDLSLACFLKSPIINIDEEALYELCIDRKGSLWGALKENKIYADITEYLKTLKHLSQTLKPFEFYSTVINTPCPSTNNKKSAQHAFIKRLGEEVLDPLEEFLNEIITFEQDNIPTLERFIFWMENSNEEIKREMEEQSKQVRIMTIHGAKGLEAPIVFLPDTILSTSAMKSDPFLWPHKTGLETPLWSPRKSGASSHYISYQDSSKKYQKQEYRRQLYVALTRAEDRLYICGCTGKKAPDPDSWYYAIEKAMHNIGSEKNGILQYNKQQSAPPDTKQKKISETKTQQTILPDWINQPCPKEPEPPRPLVPSSPSRSEPAAASPLDKNNENRFKRGNITHKLLQILPELPKQQWESVIHQYVEKETYNLSETQKNSITKETLKILNHSEFSDIFGPGSMAEVPVTGLLNGKELVSGQIDRLLIKKDKILIIDYKTNRPPPTDPKNIPEIYIHQMKLYKALISEIYPDKPVSCALIWTDNAKLMRVDV